MPDWASTLLATAIGATAALAGAGLQMWQARQAAKAAERAEWAATFGPVLGMLGDQWRDQPIAWYEETWGPVRDRLAVAAAGHPSSETRSTIFELLETLAKIRNLASNLADSDLDPAKRQATLSEYAAMRDEANALIRSLLAAGRR
jgi:hypothetical protein